MQRLVEAHAGNRSAIAKALSKGGHAITRQGVGKALQKLDLRDLADRLAVSSGRSGPRPLTPEEARGEREALLQAVHVHATAAEAMRALGIDAVATFYRRRGKVRDELVKAMLSHGGDSDAAARDLGIAEILLVQGIEALGIATSEIHPRQKATVKPASKPRSRAK